MHNLWRMEQDLLYFLLAHRSFQKRSAAFSILKMIAFSFSTLIHSRGRGINVHNSLDFCLELMDPIFLSFFPNLIQFLSFFYENIFGAPILLLHSCATPTKTPRRPWLSTSCSLLTTTAADNDLRVTLPLTQTFSRYIINGVFVLILIRL